VIINLYEAFVKIKVGFFRWQEGKRARGIKGLREQNGIEKALRPVTGMRYQRVTSRLNFTLYILFLNSFSLRIG
jgi:hypothetical protein